MSGIRLITHEEAVRTLLRELGVDETAETPYHLDFVLPEVIRSNLYHLSELDGEGAGFRPVFTRKLTGAVRRQLEAVWPPLHQDSADCFFGGGTLVSEPSPTDQILWHLKRLALLGDVIYLNDGFWLPSPIRSIPLPFSGDVAITAGLPTEDLRRLSVAAYVGGHGRLISGDKETGRGVAETLGYDEWVGWRPENIQAWATEQMLQTIRMGSASSVAFTDYEAYVSSWELRKRTPQSWIPAFGLKSASRVEPVLLCRTRTKPTRYFLGHFVGRELKLERAVSHVHVRWLQLGLSLCHGLSPLAAWEGQKLKLFPLPPQPVERHLLVYAYGLQPRLGQFLYHVPSAYLERVESLLGHFGYRNRSKGGISE